MTEFSFDPVTSTAKNAWFEQVTRLVTAEFQVEESFLSQGVPTYFLFWPQQTKQPFLRLLEKLKELNLVASLKEADGKVTLQVTPRPPVNRSNPIINLVFLAATIASTLVVGYFLLPSATGFNPFLAAALFSASILIVLGVHEMGHKITANRNKMEATSPYFIPGPPPFGTFGAVIMQKSLPANRDILFDVGASGPIVGFIVALIFSAVGIMMLIPTQIPAGQGSSFVPISWVLLMNSMSGAGLVPQPLPPNNGYYMHPIAWAGWAGMIVTMLNLLPAAMLDGGHVARSIVKGKFRWVLTALSVALLLATGVFWLMAALIVVMSFVKHPGPLDDVSPLSKGRKLLTALLIAVFILSFPINA
jgi:membrane-associated protease RseP (regulator of RpoE activity)